MNLRRRLFALLGISNDARVNVRTEDVDVTILGSPQQVQIVLESVRIALEGILQPKQAPRFADPDAVIAVNTESLIVRPTELDEKDSPYAIPEHRTVERIEASTDGEMADVDAETGTHENFTDTEPSAEGITNPGTQKPNGR